MLTLRCSAGAFLPQDSHTGTCGVPSAAQVSLLSCLIALRSLLNKSFGRGGLCHTYSFTTGNLG